MHCPIFSVMHPRKVYRTEATAGDGCLCVSGISRKYRHFQNVHFAVNVCRQEPSRYIDTEGMPSVVLDNMHAGASSGDRAGGVRVLSC